MLEDDMAKHVAVKILKEGVSREAKEDFKREVEIMSAFDHENILKLIGVVAIGENFYFDYDYDCYDCVCLILTLNTARQKMYEYLLIITTMYM